jgi:hypothetical protein
VRPVYAGDPTRNLPWRWRGRVRAAGSWSARPASRLQPPMTTEPSATTGSAAGLLPHPPAATTVNLRRRAGLLTPPPAATIVPSAAAGPRRGCGACCPVGPRPVPRHGRVRGWAVSSSPSCDNCFLRRGRAAAGTLRASSSFAARLGLMHRRRAAGVRGRLDWDPPMVVGEDGSGQPAHGPHCPQAVFECRLPSWRAPPRWRLGPPGSCSGAGPDRLTISRAGRPWLADVLCSPQRATCPLPLDPLRRPVACQAGVLLQDGVSGSCRS